MLYTSDSDLDSYPDLQKKPTLGLKKKLKLAPIIENLFLANSRNFKYDNSFLKLLP